MEQNYIKLLPLGESSFPRLIDDNMYYVDKTAYLSTFERLSNYVFFTRPRRFGKSLFLSMLRTYYDVAQAENFDHYFGNLAIGKSKTPKANAYQILYFDFSQVSSADVSQLWKRFNVYCSEQIKFFVQKYKEFYKPGFADSIANCPDLYDMLTLLKHQIEANGIECFVIIDEYDNFTNNVLNAHGHNVYHDNAHLQECAIGRARLGYPQPQRPRTVLRIPPPRV